MVARKQQITDRYQEMSEVQHILHRSGMYVGSTKEETKSLFLYDRDNAKMTHREIEYIPGMLKIIDEVISNSCDEYRRDNNLGLTKISVNIQKNGCVTVEDDGGIPVLMHPQANCYIPEFIFGRFRTSSNYDDNEDRNWIGTNGVGSKLSNVFSKRFEIYTSDGKNSYQRSWCNNMQTLNDDLIITKNKSHFLRTTFDIDFSKFDSIHNEFSDDFISLIEKRCIDAAAANPGLIVSFTSDNIQTTEWVFETFGQYIELYSDFIDIGSVIHFTSDKQQVWVYPDGNINIGFVSGAECSLGTHIKSIRMDINNAICKELHEYHNIDITPINANNKYSLFCCVSVSNPSYTSQTKEELSTPMDRFDRSGIRYELSNEFLTSIRNSEIIDIVLDWHKQKLAADDKKTTRKLNKQAKMKVRNEKFIDANSKKVAERELWLFEGDSAKSGFRTSRNPQTQAAYILKGVIKNVIGMTPLQIMKHKELADIISIVGLQWGEPIDMKKLNFSKIVISTDMDHDGDKIAGLLFVFFSHFPELFKNGMIYRALSPIITATKGNDIREFYTLKEYKKYESKLSGYHIKYTKGLGGLAPNEYKRMMRQPTMHKFKYDDMANTSLRAWFGKGLAHERKQMLKDEV